MIFNCYVWALALNSVLSVSTSFSVTGFATKLGSHSYPGSVLNKDVSSICNSNNLFHKCNNNNLMRTMNGRTQQGSLVTMYGIPKMFRWLTDQYPNINRRLSEGLTYDTVVDHFYLDMNGIIHPCTHGNSDEFVVLDETEMFKKIFSYVDRLYKLVRPRKLLYLAVDGVAPRAKMNQQRSRRFRSGKEAEELTAAIVARDGKLPDGRKFDSNCITPGTDFMLKLSLAMNKWIEFKQKTDPFWSNGAKVVFSGPDVPGEGEHKVMDYIRDYQISPEYEPQTQHVLYGLDADLIMLGLVTHEPRFMLLREKMSVVMSGRRGRGKKKDMLDYQRDDFELLELTALREMFQIQFRKFADPNTKLLNVKYDIHRIIDDFVFMCMMVGNDFLPHCPHLDIDSGALSLMLSTYIDLLPSWGDYLTDKGSIHPRRFEEFVYNLAPYEEEHFKRRSFDENEPGFGLPTTEDEFYGTFYEQGESWTNSPSIDDEQKKKQPDEDEQGSYRDFYYKEKLGVTSKEDRRAMVRDYMEGLHWVLHYYHYGCPAWDWYFPHLYSPLASDMVNLSDFYDDCDAPTEERGFRSFPFDKGTPFPSLAQLLSVLPPQSADLLPESLAELMVSEASPLAEYYPKDFTTDQNGKRQPWEAVVNIPFIEGEVLLGYVNDVLQDEKEERALSNAEKRRNMPGTVKMYVPENCGNYKAMGDGGMGPHRNRRSPDDFRRGRGGGGGG
eukprot:CAMPEP_0195527708 /NCGR_PEP_ID=MMETSP0794_2-20130614/29590_1 /TAXON_ID=515487 /ORGANISM="Stephanopyxis turris, Strain CCMP 815" /LENGTH=721 /DNA_ID=CAMNT_0040658691 /DNA_START=17 /DNA_END=2178 /DNA_ORIENTATION=-